MSILKKIMARAAAERKRILFPEAEDPRTIEAVRRLAADRIVEPVLLTPDRPPMLPGVEWLSPHDAEVRARCLAAAAEARGAQGDEVELLEDSLHFGAACVRAGLADGMVSGAVHTTAQTLRAALRILRPAEGVSVVSSFFLMELATPTEAGETVLAFADCGLVPYPDPRQLAEIAVGTAEQFRRLCGREPRVAMLSFSTHGSADHDAVSLVREATQRVRAAAPALAVDGELQGDAALISAIAASKAPGSSVAGRANVLIFPNLDSGNIAYKLVERLAAATAIGPILRGIRRPANDLSRGCSADDIALVAAVTALQAGETV